MQLLEYQAKNLLREVELPVPEGLVLRAGEPIPEVTFPVVVKSQVPVGGRGKAGGVKLAQNKKELSSIVATILQLEIKGHKPECVLVEPALNIESELYLALRVNRDKRRVEYIVTRNGGVSVESHAEEVRVVPADEESYLQVAEILQLEAVAVKKMCQKFMTIFHDDDCLLLEINPLIVTKDGDIFCADAKIEIDDNARFRQENLGWTETSNLKPLGGNIGVVANGAGMAMSTMDTIYAAGGKPANFLDIGGGTGEDVFVKNLHKITDLPNVQSIIVNIFAGITRCDEIAKGLIAARERIVDLPPLYIRLEGTNRDKAVELLAEAGMEVLPSLQACVEGALKHV